MVARRALFIILFLAGMLNSQDSGDSIAAIKSLIRSKEYSQALEQTRSALRRNGNDHRLWTLEGIVLSVTNEKAAALQAFDKALALAPTYKPALQGKVELLYPSGDDRAIPLLAELLKLDPRDETAHEMYALLEARRGGCSSALVHFRQSEKAIARHPASLEAYGDCLARTKQTQTAISVFRQLSTLLPKETYPKYDLALLLIEDKQYAEALRVLQPLLALEQADPDVLSLASEAYEGMGDTPKAVALLRQAIVLSPSSTQYYNAFALLCLDHESFQVGIDMINLGLQRISGDASLYLSRGLMYAQLAQYEQAESDFRTADLLDAQQTLSSYAMDLAELEKHKPEKALEEVRSQVKAHPDSALHHYLLARLLKTDTSEGHTRATTEAIESALMAVKLKPDFVEARDLLAGLYQDSGQDALAIEQCQVALRYAPSDQSAIYRLIMLFRHSANSAERDQVQALVKRLRDLKQAAFQSDTNRRRFKLIEEPSGKVASYQ